MKRHKHSLKNLSLHIYSLLCSFKVCLGVYLIDLKMYLTLKKIRLKKKNTRLIKKIENTFNGLKRFKKKKKTKSHFLTKT
jgi:hypothetical protein